MTTEKATRVGRDGTLETCIECGHRKATEQSFGGRKYCDSCLSTGEKIMESPVTGTTYRVTKWIDKGEGRCVAVQKEEIDPAANTNESDTRGDK